MVFCIFMIFLFQLYTGIYFTYLVDFAHGGVMPIVLCAIYLVSVLFMFYYVLDKTYHGLKNLFLIVLCLVYRAFFNGAYLFYY